MSDHFDNDFETSAQIVGNGAPWSPEDTAAARPAVNDGSAAAFDVARFAEWLPRLGAVIWLDRRDRAPAAMRPVARHRGVVLLEHPSLSALGRCTGATLHTQVTSHGPREWIAFRDGAGTALAKLFLLPDTDYLAWDEMVAASALIPATEPRERWHAHSAFLRQARARLGASWRARPLVFDLCRLPWLRTLSARPPLRLSLLGLELARSIARAEGAELVFPFHAV